ncbi:MAG: NAD-dependent epimerase/dehydratase family protein, partial [Bdellovibrionales bacterium]|nr:NAD-dependent epimerase/dehydratase family protein [Bdellovibrionales bacterium]
MKNHTVLITGGSGFIGSHLAEYYLTQNHSVIIVDNFCTGLRSNADYLKGISSSEKLTIVEADVSKPWGWVQNLSSESLQNINYVFHLASPASPPLYQEMAF